jgi:hypothetical protein
MSQQAEQYYCLQPLGALVAARVRCCPPAAQEERAKEQVASLKAEVAHLNKLIEQGAGMGVAEERTLSDLMAQKGDLARERDTQVRAPPQAQPGRLGGLQQRCSAPARLLLPEHI